MSAVRVAIAGSSGSIGTQTLDVVRSVNAVHPGAYEVTALAVSSSVDTVISQALEHRPRLIVVTDPTARDEVARRIGSQLGDTVIAGELAAVAEVADVVVNAVVG